MGQIGVAVPTCADPEMLDECLRSVLSQEGLDPWDVYVISNSSRVRAAARYWSAAWGIGFYENPGQNLGTCRSWNLAARWAFVGGLKGVLILNDDVQLLEKDTLKRVEEQVLEDPRRLIVLYMLGFSAFVMTPELQSAVGEFDEGFWPAYFEDNDYHLRVVKAGLRGFDMPCQTLHHGSASLRRWKEWEDWNAVWAFPLNARRFVDKWGGPPGHTNYTEPWDGKPERAYTIPQRMRDMNIPLPPWGSIP